MAVDSPSNTSAASRLTALYQEHAGSVFGFAMYLTGRREDAEDVVQHTFIQAFRILEAGDELMYPRSWLMRATKNQALNLIRDRHEFPTENIALEARPATDADRLEAEELAFVRATLWTLPENQHHAFVLRHWSGLSQNEIAEVLATSPAAVESLLTRARSALVEERTAADGQCRSVRTRLVEAAELTAAQVTHVGSCRKCRKAQNRLARAAGFAATFVLLPRPHVAHALASAIPGFTPPAAGIAGLGAAGAGTTAAPVGFASTSSSVAAAAKATITAKVIVAAITATAAIAVVHPVREPITTAIRDVVPGLSASPSPQVSDSATTGNGNGPPAGHGTPNAHANANANANGSTTAHGQSAAHGKTAARGKSAANASSGGNSAAHSQGATHKQTHPSSGTGTAKANPHTTTASTTKTTGNGKALGKTTGGTTTATGGNGNGKAPADPPGKAKGKP